MAKRYKVIVYAPVAEGEKIREVIGEAGGGKMGNYDFCSFSIRGVGRFRPLPGANPAIGVVGNHEEVEEERIEVEVDENVLEDVVTKIRQTHSYEQPAIDIIEIKNL